MGPEDHELPEGWIADDLQNIIEPRGEKVSPCDFPETQFIGMDHVESHTTRIIGSVPAGIMKSNAARFYANDVLYGRLRPYLNKVTQPTFDGLASAEFIVFPDTPLIKSSFLKYRLNAADFVNFAAHLNEGDRPRVSFDQIGKFKVLIPPPKEQLRIVEKIEELFSELDKGIENLKDAHQQLKVHRQALLKHAFEGKLTAQWREGHKAKLKAGDQLMNFIKQQRETRYNQQMEAWKVAVSTWQSEGRSGKKPSKPSPLKQFARLTEAEKAELLDIPHSWCWDKLGWMTCGVEYGTAAKSSEAGKIPVLRMGNIQNTRFDWTDLAYTSDQAEIEQYLLRPGDVLFNRTNSPELVGKTAIYRGERPALFAGYLIRVNQIEAIIDAQYLNLFLNSHIAKQHGNKVKTDGVNQSNINGQKLQNYPFPHCALDEQQEIVRLLDEKLSIVDQMERDTDAELVQAEALRQSILKKAFSGQLVEQDPNDEPASVLLERINAERSALAESNQKNRNGKEAA